MKIQLLLLLAVFSAAAHASDSEGKNIHQLAKEEYKNVTKEHEEQKKSGWVLSKVNKIE